AGGVELRNQGDLDLHLLGPRGFEIAQAMLVGAGSELRLGGRGSTHGGLALEAEGSVDLALLASLSPMIRRASGQVGLEINVRGPMSNPAVFGEARVQGASFLFAAFPDPIEELEGRVLFSSHRVLFEDFSARLANGQVGLSGMANLHAGGIERYLFDMSLRDVNVRPGPDVELAFGGQARLEWAEGQRLPRLSGALHLDRARYGREIQLSPTIGALNRAQRTEVQRYDPAADMVELDVQLETRNPIHIANSLFDAEIEIDDAERSFRIVGTDQRYGVIGNLDIARGLLRIRDTALAIREADIRLDDPTRVDPHFDLLAVTEIRRVSDPSSPDWRITLRAHGSMDGFQLDLGSEPQMSQEDIMLLLTFGMTRSEVDQLQAGDLGTYGLDALSNVTGVSEEVTRTLRVIDEFGIRSIYSERTNRPEPHVTIGKRISDRIRLTASTGLTGEQRDVRASAVMRINDSTSVEASYDNVNREGATFGNVGVDLRWRLEFE
ncbi:MAG: translocation/assembly module TamB, partial [Myxococcales bacterium]|nr:translocation/assembly module TamB [Myxococcales bacterium]